MIFRLVETPTEEPSEGSGGSGSRAVWPPTRKLLDAYNKLKTTDQQTNFLKRNVLPHPIFKKVFGIRTLILDCIRIYGLDPKKNAFLNLVTTMNVSMPTTKSLPNMEYVYSAFKNKTLDMNMPVLKNPSLYQRNFKDFKYTLNVFWMMSDPKKASRYLKDVSKVDVTEFLSGGTDLVTTPIKEAGVDGREGDTLFNVIEGWAEGNEYSPDEIRQRNRQRDSSKKVDVKQLEAIKKKYSDPSKYPDRNAIEKELKADGELRDGVIVYHLRIDHNDFSTIDVDKGTFWIWKNDKWEEYDTPEARKVAEFK